MDDRSVRDEVLVAIADMRRTLAESEARRSETINMALVLVDRLETTRRAWTEGLAREYRVLEALVEAGDADRAHELQIERATAISRLAAEISPPAEALN